MEPSQHERADIAVQAADAVADRTLAVTFAAHVRHTE